MLNGNNNQSAMDKTLKILRDIINDAVFLHDAEDLQELKENIDSLFFRANRQLIKETMPDNPGLTT